MSLELWICIFPQQVCCLSHLIVSSAESCYIPFLYILSSEIYTIEFSYSHIASIQWNPSVTSSLPKSFSIDDASFILVYSLFLLLSHPVVVSGDPLQDSPHSFTMIWPIWRDLVHCAASLHATPHCAYPRALWAQHVPQTGNKSNDCRGS